MKHRTYTAIAGLCLLASVAGVSAHGDLHERIEAVTSEIRRKPDDAALYFKRAELHRLHNEVAGAERDYDRAGKLAPELTAVHLGRGQLMLAAGRWKEAAASIDEYLEAHPREGEAWVIRARVHAGSGEHLQAARAFDKALKHLSRPEPDHYLEAARAFTAAGKRYVDEAIAVLDAGVEQLGPIVTLTLPAIELELAQKRYDSALGRVGAAMAKAPRKEAWLERHGDILVMLKRTDDAHAEFQKALTAINALPPRARNTRATRELEQRLRTKLTRPAL